MKKMSVQNWLHFKYIYNNGIIKLKDNSYIKIIEIKPINFNLKSEFEKEAILNSYKLFLKTCDFNMQIVIQSTRNNFSKNIINLKNENKKENNKKIKELYINYINFIQEKSKFQKSNFKKFFIIIKNPINNKIEENIIFENLNEKYLKIRECLNRCGNVVEECNSKEEIIEILHSFYDIEKYELLKEVEK